MNDATHLRRVLTAWILADDRPEEVTVGQGAAGDGHVSTWPVAAVLYELWDDATVLPHPVAERLHLPPEATFAHAARLIWSVCDDDLFPAATHGQAVRHLVGLDPDTVATYHRAVDQRVQRGPSSDRPPPSLREVSRVVENLVD